LGVKLLNRTNQSNQKRVLLSAAVRLATTFLAPRGAFVTKVFRSQDFNAILFCLRQLFDKVEVHKPAASRGSSAEIYIVCLKYKAPARIHPELLDIKHLFSVDSDKEFPIIDVLSSNKSKKRPSAGYEPGVTVLRNVGLASDFIWSDAQTPREFLGLLY
jgi:AdoMet-dependent rRNA methyltransferase SPB1